MTEKEKLERELDILWNQFWDLDLIRNFLLLEEHPGKTQEVIQNDITTRDRKYRGLQVSIYHKLIDTQYKLNNLS